MEFSIIDKDGESNARTGVLQLARGTVETPVFMPVGTQATVKALTPRDLKEVGAQIILANAYHLMLRPGEELVKEFGGVSEFMGWHGPVLTDSGGYQVFSLAQSRKLTADGVLFQSHIDGSEHFLSPERAVEIQAALGSDIMMALDICPPKEASYDEVAEGLVITHDWARRCLEKKAKLQQTDEKVREQNLFPIVQGGVHLNLRTESAEFLSSLNAPGYAIGGVSVGEGAEAMRAVVEHTTPLLPLMKPRYLMGVGHPRDLLMAVGAGVDMFDCVLPTRNGRNGQAFTVNGPINLRNAEHRHSKEPVDTQCSCYACANFSRGYLRHLFISGEMLASQLISLHNVRFLVNLMDEARKAIAAKAFSAFAEKTMESFEI